jgi:hypothetical protein
MVHAHQFTLDQRVGLRELSALHDRSIADFIRDAIDAYLESWSGLPQSVKVEQAIAFAGQFAPGSRDVSANADRHLVEAFRR